MSLCGTVDKADGVADNACQRTAHQVDYASMPGEVTCAQLAAEVETTPLGLVDELRMFRNPIVVGGGTPFLPPVTLDVAHDLIETRTFGRRVIYERYRRVRVARLTPPTARPPRELHQAMRRASESARPRALTRA
jgi:hypothetical protein